MLNVLSSQSIKTGTRPFAIIGLIVVGNPTAQVITSEPFGI